MAQLADITAPSPRVNAALLPSFIGKKVTLVGRVEGVEGNEMRLRTSDDAVVTVALQGIAPQVRLPGQQRRQVRRRSACCGGQAHAPRCVHSGPAPLPERAALHTPPRPLRCRPRCWR